ncbi:MAG TPA: DUF423 domain-containing protein [Leptolyngbyaceae cyanobacterium M65_K2018_010]|nr:DUF423 domain-containing protein [Leptolyngbyaceae cyanobacterium M65_K2018_010]
MPLDRLFLALAALLGGTAVAIGAFATHTLRSQLSPRLMEIFETGARYQMYHALALAVVALALGYQLGVPTWLAIAGWAFILGIVIFSGALYALSLSGISVLGAIAPLGGALLIVGWGCLAIAAWLGRPGAA